MPRIIDLDKLAPEDIEVVCDGQTYLLPGDIPIGRWAAIVQAAEQVDSAEDQLAAGRELEEQVLSLFRLRQPDLDQLPLGPVRLVGLLSQLYGPDEDEDGEGDADPSEPAERAGTKTSNHRPKRKRAK